MINREYQVFKHNDYKPYARLVVNGKLATDINRVPYKPYPLTGPEFKRILSESGMTDKMISKVVRQLGRNAENDDNILDFSPVMGFNNTKDKYYWSSDGLALSKESLNTDLLNSQLSNYYNWLNNDTTDITKAILATALSSVVTKLYNNFTPKTFDSLSVNITGTSSIGKSTISDLARHMYIDDINTDENYLTQNPTDSFMGDMINGKQGSIIIREDQTSSEESAKELTNTIYRFSSGNFRQNSKRVCSNYLITLLTSSESPLPLETHNSGIMRRFIEFDTKHLSNNNCKDSLLKDLDAVYKCKSYTTNLVVPELTKAFILNCIDSSVHLKNEIDSYKLYLEKQVYFKTSDNSNLLTSQIKYTAAIAIAWKYYLLTINEYTNSLSTNSIEIQINNIANIIIDSFHHKTNNIATLRNIHSLLVKVGLEDGYKISNRVITLDSEAKDKVLNQLELSMTTDEFNNLMGNHIQTRVKANIRGKNTTGFKVHEDFHFKFFKEDN